MDNIQRKRKPSKQAKTYRFSPVTLALVQAIAEQEEKTYTAVIEEAIHKSAQKIIKYTV